MLAVITHDGTSLIDPADFKILSSSFPISSSLQCSMNIWSPDNSQLYLANSSSIKRYTPSECLLEELYHGADPVTCLAMKDKNTVLFAAANKVWSLDCTCSPREILSTLEPHKNAVTMISASNDGTLLVSVSASAVFVHNLPLSSHTQLKGLPNKKPVTCCLLHQHSKTKLLLGVGRDVVVCDLMRPSSPLKTIRIPESGDIVGIAASPFSKTLVAVVTSTGDVTLVDLDKDNGILKTVSVKTPLTCCAFTAEGAAIYLGTESGKLLILDLRSLDKEPKSFTIGDGGAPVRGINVHGKSKSRLTDTVSTKAKSSSIASIRSPPQHSTFSTRTPSTGPVVASFGFKSPPRVTVASKIRGGGVTPKKLFTPTRTPLLGTENLKLGARLASSRSPLSHRSKPLRPQRGKKQEENHETEVGSPSSKNRELANARQRVQPNSAYKVGQDVGFLGLGSAPESISGHLAAMRVRSGSHLSGGLRDESDRHKTRSHRVVSESAGGVSMGRKSRPISTGPSQSIVSSSKVVNGVARTQRKQEQRSATPGNGDDHLDLSSPELPREPVTPISLGENGTKALLASATSSGIDTLGLTDPEVVIRATGRGQKGKRKENVVEVKKTRFADDVDGKGSSTVGDGSEDEILIEERRDEEGEELSLQVSPCRPTAPPTWLRSPHRPSVGNLNMNTAAQDFLRSIVHDVIYDFQRETKAEMMGLHLDLVRMGRGWKQELRQMMDEWSGEIQELKAENKRLKEENERLRMGFASD